MRISDWSSDVCSSDLDLPNRSLRHRQFLVPNEVEGDIDDHIFLAADHPPPAELDQDLAGIETILFGRIFGMAQETGINACIAQAARIALEEYGDETRRESVGTNVRRSVLGGSLKQKK